MKISGAYFVNMIASCGKWISCAYFRNTKIQCGTHDLILCTASKMRVAKRLSTAKCARV